jgi:hypothetical protein
MLQRLIFALHLFFVIASWCVPFLFDWRLVCAVYTVVMLQFWVFGRCLMNEGHGTDDVGSDETFYAQLLERLGFRFSRSAVKTVVRKWLLPVLGLVAIGWQVGLGKSPLWNIFF